MEVFIGTMSGLFVGMFLTAVFQANRNVKDKKELKYTTILLDYYKDKCKEMKKELRKYESKN